MIFYMNFSRSVSRNFCKDFPIIPPRNYLTSWIYGSMPSMDSSKLYKSMDSMDFPKDSSTISSQDSFRNSCWDSSRNSTGESSRNFFRNPSEFIKKSQRFKQCVKNKAPQAKNKQERGHGNDALLFRKQILIKIAPESVRNKSSGNICVTPFIT